MEVYIKGKFEDGVGASAYVLVDGYTVRGRGSTRFGSSFVLEGRRYDCDAFTTEIISAICGVARCPKDEAVRVYSNNKSVVKWLDRGEEPDARRPLLDVWRRRTLGREVVVAWVPRFDHDPMGNPWNKECNDLAEKELGR